MNIHFYTLGCKVNQYETEAMREKFISLGFCDDKNSPPDAVVINSCSVTAESDRKTRQLVHKIRKNYPDCVITLTGCSVQAFPDDNSQLPADVIIGNCDVNKVVEKTVEYFNTKSKCFFIEKHQDGEVYNTLPISSFNERTRAYMKIEDGCNRFCSYCIIPYARGRVRSRDLSDIKAEAERLSKNGYKEIVLVGINLSAYGMGSDINICDAVHTVAAVDGILRVRLGSLEPDHITDEMLMRLKNEPKFCPQFHLSLQSGSDATLKRMNRHYDSAFYYDLVTRIRKIFDFPAITTDIMVGFSGETEEEFTESLAFAEKLRFSKAHIFAYSKRPGTVAAGLPHQVTNAQKHNRSKLMTEVTLKSEREFLSSHIGKTLPVLFEGDNSGFTPDYSKVKVNGVEIQQGEIHNVKITDFDGENLIGKLI